MSARQIMTPDLAAPVPVAARVVEAQELAPLSAGMGPPAWADPVWIAAELAQHVAAMTAPGSDLQALALRAAGVVARVEVPS